MTARDNAIIEYIKKNKGATIEQIQHAFFPSYRTASVRLKKLADNKLLKRFIHPTIGKVVYYKKKKPSYHDLIICDIVNTLEGKYIDYETTPRLEDTRPDIVFYLKSKKFLIIEIEIFNKVSKEKITKMHSYMEDKPHEVIIVSKWASNRKEGRINIRELKKLSNYT